MANSEAQLARLLALIPYLQAHPNIPVEEAAATFEVSEKTLLGDLKILWMCGLPGQGGGDLIEIDQDLLENEGLIRLSNADFLTAPLTLSPDEAFSLVLALNYIQSLSTSTVGAAAESALAKLQDALPDPLMAAGSVTLATASVPVRDAIETALQRGESLQLIYDGQRRYSTPIVDPARVILRKGVAYLQAFSLDADDWRTYRMERIANAEPLGEPAEDHGTPPEIPQDWNDALPFIGEVTLHVTRAGRWIADYYPVRSVRALDADVTQIRLGIGDESWLRALLLRLGDAVVAVDPPAAARPAQEAAHEALEAYRQLGEATGSQG